MSADFSCDADIAERIEGSLDSIGELTDCVFRRSVEGEKGETGDPPLEELNPDMLLLPVRDGNHFLGLTDCLLSCTTWLMAFSTTCV